MLFLFPLILFIDKMPIANTAHRANPFVEKITPSNLAS